jgi:drug/metabolite transporter (DMT)-like permease
LALTAAALAAFAANSILCRLALAEGEIDPASFTVVRMVSGAVVLAALVAGRGRLAALVGAASWRSAAALLAYAVLFSFAYVTLDAGMGALLLFPAVQVTMIAGAILAGERPRPLRWLGIAIALAGLVWLVAPGATAPPATGAGLMVLAGIAWGVYSLRGSGGHDPTAATAGNFALAAPAALPLLLLVPAAGPLTWAGVALAAASGAVASGLGYAVWYAVLHHLDRTIAAVAQLLVPPLAVVAGVVLLGEVATPRLALAGLAILGGVALSIRGGSRRQP